jgi:hypothetical protein
MPKNNFCRYKIINLVLVHHSQLKLKKMNTQTTAAVKQNTLAFINRISERVTTLSEELESLKNEVNEAAQSFPYVHTSDSLGHWIPRGNEVATIISLLKEIDTEGCKEVVREFGVKDAAQIQELKPFVQKICDEIISSVKLYIEDMGEDEMVNNVYLNSEYKVQFSINYEKILKQVADAKTDNFNYIFDREVFEMAAAIKSTEIVLTHSNILL